MKALDGISHRNDVSAAIDRRKSVSNHVAVALIAYTAINIFLTVEAIKDTGLRSLSMVCLILLIAGIIPACHKLEKTNNPRETLKIRSWDKVCRRIPR